MLLTRDIYPEIEGGRCNGRQWALDNGQL